MNKIKKGRTIAITVDELLDSIRLKLAVEAFNRGDRSFLKPLLIELCLEIFLATRSVLTKRVGKAAGPGWISPTTGETIGKGLTAGELTSYIRSLDVGVLDNLNVHWNLTDAEKELYSKDPKGLLSDKEREELFDRVKRRFGME